MNITHNLPWAYDAMEPYISSRIMHLHFDKHHQGYVSKYNDMIKDAANADLANLSLLEVLQKLAAEIKSGNTTRLALFRNGGQAWNHDFLWKSMSVGCDSGAFAALLKMDFSKFRDLFIDNGVKHFASGWLWIVQNGNDIDLCTTANEESPLFMANKYTTIINPVDASTTTPLVVCDLWEHAYYLQYENNRKHYLEKFFDHLMNWDFAVNNFKKPV